MGYIGHSRSERSQEAIDNGLLIYSQLSAWQKRAVDSGVVKPCEWHHTGKYFNKTNYFDPQDFEGLNPKDFPNVPKQKPTPSEHWYVLVSADWGGTSKHPRIVGADVQVTNKITDRQKNANKYSRYGGYIKEFDNEDDAKAFAKTAKLESMKRRTDSMRHTHRYNEGLGTNFDDYEYDEDATWYAPVITDVNEIIVLIKQGKFYGGNARKGLCFTIQAHGSRTVRNLGGKRWHEDTNNSRSWGRIWYNGEMLFSESATLNVLRSHMIKFLREDFDSSQPTKITTRVTKEIEESANKSLKRNKRNAMIESACQARFTRKETFEYKGHTIIKESKDSWKLKFGNSDFSYKSLNEAKSAVDDLIKEGLFESLITTRM